jgi:Fe-S cluster assembly iron-binding protein IscA
MIDITPVARENLISFLTEKKLPLKVRLALSSCDGIGEQLILVPDKPAPGDISVDFDPLTLCLNRDLQALVGRVRVDFRDEGQDYGFVIECERSPEDAGGCADCTDCTDCA